MYNSSSIYFEEEKEVGQQSPELVPLLIGTIFGVAVTGLVAWRILRRRVDAVKQELSAALIEAARLGERTSNYSELAQDRAKQIESLLADADRVRGQIQLMFSEQEQLKVNLATLTTKLEDERSQHPEKIALLTDAQDKFSSAFETLANRILEDKSQRFAETNQANLDQLLGPLKTKLHEFQQKVEYVYDTERTDRTALATQVTQLMELNQQLSQDAHNLTHALKGSGKTQGNWGEVILERILASSGLRRGQEYELRETYMRENGSRAQPDREVSERNQG